MANLKYCDQHNMVALLEKTDGSEGFHQIVDFLNAFHIRFALSENPTIYDSHIKQSWQTATVNTLNNGEQEITATVNGHVKTVTIASTQLLIAQKEEAGIQLQVEKFDLMAAAGDCEDIEEVNVNCIFMTNLQQASTLRKLPSTILMDQLRYSNMKIVIIMRC
ncbi:hypothetical protein Tco_0606037 [Tanacetum coccineum]